MMAATWTAGITAAAGTEFAWDFVFCISFLNKKTNKVSCDGWFDYVMIDLKTGKGMRITEEMIEKYSI